LISIVNKEGNDRNQYSEVKMIDALYSGEIGTPKLPVYYVNYIIPPETRVTEITVTNSTTVTYQLEHPVFPNQHPIPCGLDCVQPPFVTPDQSIYSSSAPFPDIQTAVVNQGYFDGANNIVQIEVRPFRYFPITNTLMSCQQ
jgi:hypothetical protein